MLHSGLRDSSPSFFLQPGQDDKGGRDPQVIIISMAIALA